MQDRSTRVLLVEDDPQDVILVARTLSSGSAVNPRFELVHAGSVRSGLQSLAKGAFDVLLVDLHLPDSRGAQTIHRLRKRSDLPMVVFTVAGDDETALAALQAGAEDYVVKSEIGGSILPRAIRYAIERRRLRQENERASEKLLRAEKLESLAIMAAGIAHDFNNMLTGILGNASIARLTLSPDAPVQRQISAVIERAKLASRLVAQLFTLSGASILRGHRLDLSSEVREVESLLSGSVDERVTLELELAAGLPAIEADPSQIHQVLLNLVRNAGESISGAGTVWVRTFEAEGDPAAVADLVPGSRLRSRRQVVLEVRDTGCGMDAPTRARIFDPFFTTKKSGQGLGLAGTLAIVRGQGGGIALESSPECGSCFRVHFAVAEASTAAVSTGVDDVQRVTEIQGHGIVLLVDDDASVIDYASYVLERLGYDVVVARDGQEAVEVFRRRSQEIDLVLLDLMMPRKNGEEALGELRAIREDVRVVLSSGHDLDQASRRPVFRGLRGLLQKPYDEEGLAAAVKRALGPEYAQSH